MAIETIYRCDVCDEESRDKTFVAGAISIFSHCAEKCGEHKLLLCELCMGQALPVAVLSGARKKAADILSAAMLDNPYSALKAAMDRAGILHGRNDSEDEPPDKIQ